MRRKQEHEGGLGRIIVGIAIVIDIPEDVERATWRAPRGTRFSRIAIGEER